MNLQDGVRLLNQRQAAAIVGVHARTLRDAIKNGRGPALTQINKRRLVRSDCLAAWIEGNTAKRPTDAASFASPAEAMVAISERCA